MGISKLLTGLALAASIAFSAEFTVMTEEYPPYNYTENSVLKGMATDTLKEVFKKLNHPDLIEVLPWSRAYNIIQKQDNMILYSMTRTESREYV